MSKQETIGLVGSQKLYGTPAEMSAMFGISVAELKKLRHLKQGSPYRLLGRKVLYSVASFEEWLESAAPLQVPESA